MKSLKYIGVQLGDHTFECAETGEQFRVSGMEMAHHFDSPQAQQPQGGYKGVIGDAHPSSRARRREVRLREE
jgi:hypothetical protein